MDGSWFSSDKFDTLIMVCVCAPEEHYLKGLLAFCVSLAFVPNSWVYKQYSLELLHIQSAHYDLVLYKLNSQVLLVPLGCFKVVWLLCYMCFLCYFL